MKTNIPKLFLSTLLAQMMCFSVVLSHTHAKDVASLARNTPAANSGKLAPSDITAKALGDLHHHVDKASIKHIAGDQGSTTAARVRELNPLDADTIDTSLFGRFRDFMLRVRLVASLIYSYA